MTFRYGTDGIRLCIETADRFGRLRRTDLTRSLRQAAAGQVNQTREVPASVCRWSIGPRRLYKWMWSRERGPALPRLWSWT